MRRLKAVEYSVPLLARAASGTHEDDWWRVQNPLPVDAAFLWCFQPPDGRSVVFVFEHESFAECPEGAAIPRAALIYQSHRHIVEEVNAEANSS